MSDGPADLFTTLRSACGDAWEAYVRHPFVGALADGSLPEAAFRHYLAQDYLFLIQFARAYGLAAYKAQRLAEIREAARTLGAIIDTEMDLHVDYCARWGLGAADLEATPADHATLAYTRYVLDRGMAGDLLDLHVALAPCVIGYGEIGARLASDPATRRDGNPYAPWIDMYAGAEYRDVASAARAQLNRLVADVDTPARRTALAATFAEATRLETAFWQMGLDAARRAGR